MNKFYLNCVTFIIFFFEKMDVNELINLLNKLNNTSDSRITNTSNELLETLKTVQNCTSCKKDNIKEIYFHGLINEIENYLVKLEKKEKEEEEDNIIYILNNRLIKIDNELNKKVLCDDCKEKKIENLTNKLFHLLDKLINKSDINVRITNSSNELLETLKMIENCISCKHMKKEYYFDGFHKSTRMFSGV